MRTLKVVDDDAIKEAAQAAIGATGDLQAAEAGELTEPATSAKIAQVRDEGGRVAEPPSVTATIPVLPNPDVSHAQKLYVEDRARLTNYEQSLTLLQDERSNLVARFELALADVERRILDHELCRNMATGSISIYEEATNK